MLQLLQALHETQEGEGTSPKGPDPSAPGTAALPEANDEPVRASSQGVGQPRPASSQHLATASGSDAGPKASESRSADQQWVPVANEPSTFTSSDAAPSQPTSQDDAPACRPVSSQLSMLCFVFGNTCTPSPWDPVQFLPCRTCLHLHATTCMLCWSNAMQGCSLSEAFAHVTCSVFFFFFLQPIITKGRWK